MKVRLICLSVVLCLLGFGAVLAQSPGHSKAFGKTLGEWMVLYQTWALGGDQEDHEKDMVFLPNVATTPAEDGYWEYDSDREVWVYYAETSTTLDVGEKFATPLWGYYGEAFEDDSEDDPDDEGVLAVLNSALMEVWLDDELIISSEDEDFADHWYGPEYFDDPIVYEETAYNGAVSAIWIIGYGFVHPPLSKGDHTLVAHLLSEDLGYEHWLTLNIEVKKK